MPQPIEQVVPIGAGCRGINLYADPRSLADDELVKGTNLFPNVQGMLETRPTVSFSEVVPSITTQVWGFALAAPETGYRFVAAYTDGSAVPTLIAWLDYSTKVTIALKNPFTQRPLFLNFLGETLCFPRNGEEGVYVLTKKLGALQWVHRSFVISSTEATAFGVTAQTQSAPVCPEVAFVYSGGGRERLVLANFGPGNETVFCMSDDAYPNTYVVAAGQYLPYWVFIGSDVLAFDAPRSSNLPNSETDAIQGGCTVQLQAVGSPVTEAALLLGSRSAYLLTGAFLLTTDTTGNNPIGSATLSRVNTDCGLAAEGTITRTPYGIIWAGPDDVWMLDLAGQVPRRIGTKLRPALLSSPPSDRWRWTGAYFNGVYILGICTEAERLAGSNSITPDHYCNFDYYWLDLRAGPPPDAASARWFGPMQYSVTNLGPNGADQDFYTGLGPLLSTSRGQGQTGDAVLCLLPSWEGTYGNLCDLTSATNQFDCAARILADAMAWPQSSLVEIGRVCSPTTPNGRFFVCTTAGTTGSTEPSWPGSGTVADGSVTWTELSTGCAYNTGYPISNAGYVGGLNAQGLPDFDFFTKEYTFGRLFERKTLQSLELGMQSSQRQQLNVEFQQEMGAVNESATLQTGKLGAALPFTLGTQLVSEQPSYRAVRPDSSTRVLANSFRFRGYPSDGFVVDVDNQTIQFIVGAALVTATVATGIYGTVDTLAAAIAAAIQTAWRAAGLGASGTVGYTVGNNSGFPVFSRYQPAKFAWSGFTASGNAVSLFGLGGCLSYLGFGDTSRAGTFTDNGSLYASSLVPPVNPTRWRFIGAVLRARMWARRSLSNQG